MTDGDKKAMSDKFYCHAKATWEIYGPTWGPGSGCDACDAHKNDLMEPGDTAHRIK